MFLISPRVSASVFKRVSERTEPNFFIGSVSPDKPERKAFSASSTDMSLNEAMSTASSVNDVENFLVSSSPKPKALNKLPKVPTDVSAARSDIPKLAVAPLAHVSICFAFSPNTTPTLDIASLRFEAAITESLANMAICAPPNASPMLVAMPFIWVLNLFMPLPATFTLSSTPLIAASAWANPALSCVTSA